MPLALQTQLGQLCSWRTICQHQQATGLAGRCHSKKSQSHRPFADILKTKHLVSRTPTFPNIYEPVPAIATTDSETHFDTDA